jgi:hypothetical protein
MRHPESLERSQHLEQVRREVNAALADGGSPRQRRTDSFGPSYGFASVGDFYGQNSGSFWPRR